MSNINPVSLDDTLSLIQLARETALSRGNQAQASRLAPVVHDLSQLVSTTHEAKTAVPPAAPGILGQSDFRALLEATQKKSAAPAAESSPLERNQLVNSMSAAEMSDVDIARQLGMSRDDVRMILSVNQKTKSIGR